MPSGEPPEGPPQPKKQRLSVSEARAAAAAALEADAASLDRANKAREVADRAAAKEAAASAHADAATAKRSEAARAMATVSADEVQDKRAAQLKEREAKAAAARAEGARAAAKAAAMKAEAAAARARTASTPPMQTALLNTLQSAVLHGPLMHLRHRMPTHLLSPPAATPPASADTKPAQAGGVQFVPMYHNGGGRASTTTQTAPTPMHLDTLPVPALTNGAGTSSGAGLGGVPPMPALAPASTTNADGVLVASKAMAAAAAATATRPASAASGKPAAERPPPRVTAVRDDCGRRCVPAELVGRTVSVWSHDTARYHTARVVGYDGASHQHTLAFLPSYETVKRILCSSLWDAARGDAQPNAPVWELHATPRITETADGLALQLAPDSWAGYAGIEVDARLPPGVAPGRYSIAAIPAPKGRRARTQHSEAAGGVAAGPSKAEHAAVYMTALEAAVQLARITHAQAEAHRQQQHERQRHAQQLQMEAQAQLLLLQAQPQPAQPAQPASAAPPALPAASEADLQRALAETRQASLEDCYHMGLVASPPARAPRPQSFSLMESVRGKGKLNVLQGLALHTELLSALEQRHLVAFTQRMCELGDEGSLVNRTYSAPRKWMRGKGRITVQLGCCYNYATDSRGNPPGILRHEKVAGLPRLLEQVIIPPTPHADFHAYPCIPTCRGSSRRWSIGWSAAASSRSGRAPTRASSTSTRRATASRRTSTTTTSRGRS